MIRCCGASSGTFGDLRRHSRLFLGCSRSVLVFSENVLTAVRNGSHDCWFHDALGDFWNVHDDVDLTTYIIRPRTCVSLIVYHQRHPRSQYLLSSLSIKTLNHSSYKHTNTLLKYQAACPSHANSSASSAPSSRCSTSPSGGRSPALATHNSALSSTTLSSMHLSRHALQSTSQRKGITTSWRRSCRG